MAQTETEDNLARAKQCAQGCFESIRDEVYKLRVAEAEENDGDTDDYGLDDAYEGIAREAGYSLIIDNTKDGAVCRWRKDEVRRYKTDELLEPAVENQTVYDTDAEAWRACCRENNLIPSIDDARQRLNEGAYGLAVRSGWYSPGETPEAEEYQITLAGGGPAVRLVGDLGQWNQPESARLQCQDWFTPWTDYYPEDSDADAILLDYAHGFYFGD